METQISDLENVGDLGTTPVERVLAFFTSQGASGALLFSSGIKQKAVELCDGTPTAVFSNLDAERLGDRLVATKVISAAQLEEVIASSAPNTSLGERLVAAGSLSERALHAALQTQAVEKMLELLSWKQGHYRFHEDQTIRSAMT